MIEVMWQRIAVIAGVVGLVAACSAGAVQDPSPVEIVASTQTVTETTSVTVTSTVESAAEPLPTMFSCVKDSSAKVFQIIRSGDTFTGSVTSVAIYGEGGDAELYSESYRIHGSIVGSDFEFTAEGERMPGFGTVAGGHVVVNEAAPRGDVIGSLCDPTDPARWNALIQNFTDSVDFAHLVAADNG